LSLFSATLADLDVDHVATNAILGQLSTGRQTLLAFHEFLPVKDRFDYLTVRTC
jgi:hypothetical protein